MTTFEYSPIIELQPADLNKWGSNGWQVVWMQSIYKEAETPAWKGGDEKIYPIEEWFRVIFMRETEEKMFLPNGGVQFDTIKETITPP
jgi:hypothetical protein